jgi:hypothetical protein
LQITSQHWQGQQLLQPLRAPAAACNALAAAALLCTASLKESKVGNRSDDLMHK